MRERFLQVCALALVGGCVAASSLGSVQATEQGTHRQAPNSPAAATHSWVFSPVGRKINDKAGNAGLRLSGRWAAASLAGSTGAVAFARPSYGRVASRRTLQPDSKPFAVSIVFRVKTGMRIFSRDDTPNLVQKGAAGARGQWKIELAPGAGGRAQCRLKGTARRITIKSSVTGIVADRGWHTVTCARFDHRVVIIVDGVVRRSSASVGRVSNAAPMTVANKPILSGTDQFVGLIDSLAIAKGANPIRRALAAVN